MKNGFLQNISEDYGQWFLCAFDVFPSVIAHEYWRLHELCEQGEPYGVYTQIKDVYEVTLKFCVLLACAQGTAEGDEGFLDEVVCLVTDPNLTMGSWEYIGDKAIGYYKRTHKTDSVICALLQRVIPFYKKHRIVNWRNEKIGHGALGFAEDENYKRDVKNHIRRLKELFESTDEYLANIRVASGGEVLQGYRKARRISSSEEIRIEIEKDQFSFSLDPFVELMDNVYSPENSREIFLFDSQNRRNLKATLQSYASGSREKKWCALFSELAERRNALGGPCMEAAVDSKGITSQEEDVINSLEYSIADHEFVPPESVLKWLQEFVNSHEQGTCLLRMSRGTGKSTFCAKLNCRYENPLIIDTDLDVRTYHIHRMQLSGAEDFEREIEFQWSYSYDGPPLTRYDRIVDYINKGKSRAEAFVAYLTQIRDITRQYRHKRYIMMVLDGIDEIKQEEVWSYLEFDKIQIPEGVYILTSCRSGDEISDDKATTLQSNIGKLAVAEIKTIERNDEDNLLFLENYTDNVLSVKLSEKVKKEIWHLADYRVLYLSMLYTLINSGESPENLLNQGGNVVQSYMDLLSEKYGEKQFGYLQELLIVLSTFGEITPLTMRELSELTGKNGTVTLEMLGKIADISPMLKKEYGYVIDEAYYQGDNRYHIVNETVAQALRNSVSYSEDYIAECAGAAVDCVRSFADAETEADATVWTSLMVVAGMFNLLNDVRLEAVIGDESAWMGFVLNVGEKLLEKADVLNLKWICLMVSASAEWLQKKQYAQNQEDEYKAYFLLARATMKKGEAEEALKWIEKAGRCIQPGDEYNGLCLNLLRIEALSFLPAHMLEAEALLNNDLKRYKQYDDLYIKANLTLIRLSKRRSKLKVRGASMLQDKTTVLRSMYALLRIAKIKDLAKQDKKTLIGFVDEYLNMRYRDDGSLLMRTKLGKRMTRKKLELLCRLILNEEYKDELEQLIRMSKDSVFVFRKFCEEYNNTRFADFYLGKKQAEYVRNRIIDRMMLEDDKGMITDRAALGRLILKNAQAYDSDRRRFKTNVSQLYRGLSIFTALKNKSLMKDNDYESLCECRYLIAEYELELGLPAIEDDPEKLHRLRRSVVDKGIATIQSMEQQFQTSNFRYQSGERRELNLIYKLLLEYSDVICSQETEELEQYKKKAKDRNSLERKHGFGSNLLVWLVFYAVLWLLPFSVMIKGVTAVAFVILACFIQYLVNYSVLKEQISDKKYLLKATLEALLVHFIYMFSFGAAGFVLYWLAHFYQDFFSISITDIKNIDPLMVFLLMLFGVPLIIMSLITEDLPSFGLFRIWMKIRKWPDTLSQFK